MIYEKRISMLEKMYDGLQNDSGKLVKAVVQDLGRDADETHLAEIRSVMVEIRRTKRRLRRWMRGKRYGLFPLSRCVPEPYGNVLILSPWNYPLSTCLHPLVHAIAAGNQVTVKPSEVTSTVESALAEWIKDHVPEVEVVTGDASVAEELLNRDWNFIFFTGSTRVGKLVAQRCAKDLIPYTLELGGKSPVVLDKGVNLDLVASRVLWGKGMNAGQICIAPDYVLVPASQREALAKKMSGAPYRAKIVNEHHEKRLTNLGWTGGITVLDTNVHEEIFGPILPIVAYHDKKELEELLSRYPDPLAMYVFSERERFVKDVTSWVRSGSVVVNDVLIQIMTGAPFGGVGSSGHGRYIGKAGFDCFSYTRTYVKQKLKPSILDKYREKYN